MITKFKIYETLHRKPKVGDYIIGTVRNRSVGMFDNSYKPNDSTTEMGEITYINPQGGIRFVRFEGDGKDHFINLKNVDYWSDNKEEIINHQKTKMYNI